MNSVRSRRYAHTRKRVPGRASSFLPHKLLARTPTFGGYPSDGEILKQPRSLANRVTNRAQASKIGTNRSRRHRGAPIPPRRLVAVETGPPRSCNNLKDFCPAPCSRSLEPRRAIDDVLQWSSVQDRRPRDPVSGLQFVSPRSLSIADLRASRLDAFRGTPGQASPPPRSPLGPQTGQSHADSISTRGPDGPGASQTPTNARERARGRNIRLNPYPVPYPEALNVQEKPSKPLFLW